MSSSSRHGHDQEVELEEGLSTDIALELDSSPNLSHGEAVHKLSRFVYHHTLLL